MNRRTDRAITACAMAYLLVSCTWLLTRRPLWIDEAISLGATRQLRQTIRGTGGTMALYYVLLDGWTAAFGTSVVALRSLSVVLVLVDVLALSVLLPRLLPPTEARLALVVTAALPVMAKMGQDARAYALVLLVTIGCWTCLTRAVEADGDGRTRPARLWSLAMAPLFVAGLCSHALFVLQIPAMVLSVAIHVRRPRLLVGLVPAGAAGLVTVGALLSIGARDVGDWIPATNRDFAWQLTGHLLAPRSWAMVVMGGLALAGTITVARRPAGDAVARWKACVPVWWGFSPVALLFALSVVRPSLLGRYVSGSVPALGILVAVGLHRAWDHASRRRPLVPARAGLAGMVTLALLASLVIGRVPRPHITFEDWDAAARYVAAQARPGDGLVFSFAGDDQSHRDTVRPPFEAAWSHLPSPKVELVALSPARPLGEVRRFDALTDPRVLSARMVSVERVWVVQFPGFWQSLRDLLRIEPARSQFVRRAPATFDGGMQVILLERR